MRPVRGCARRWTALRFAGDRARSWGRAVGFVPAMTQAPPLVVTADPVVRARVERVAAAAQVRPDQISAAPGIGAWLRAAVILLDAALLQAVVAAGLPRRAGVVVLASATLPDDLWQASLAVGAERVAVGEESDRLLVQLLGDAAFAGSAGPDGAGPLVAVVSACGGAGGSVFAAALAMTAARERHTTVLCDLDAAGPGLDVTLGAEGVGGARWGDIDATDGRIPADALVQALPAVRSGRGSVSLLCFGAQRATLSWQIREIDAVDAVFDSTRRAGAFTVADVPRPWTSPADRAVARADLTVLVAPADVRGAVGAARLAPQLAASGGRVGLVVRGPSPGGVGAEDIAAVADLPLLAAMRPQPGLARSIDAGDGLGGRGRGPLWRTAARVLEAVGDRP